MSANSLRVMVASEDPELRHQIVQLVEHQSGVKVVGQASNAIEALSKARSLRPEVTVVDPYLPYQFGLDGVPLSRMSGLDMAMGVAEELPDSKVILLSNPYPYPFLDGGTGPKAELCRYQGGACTPFGLKELRSEPAPEGRVVYADVLIDERVPVRNRALALSDNLLVGGGLAFVGGLALILTMIGAIAGVALAGAGLATMAVAIAIKGVVKCWPECASEEDAAE